MARRPPPENQAALFAFDNQTGMDRAALTQDLRPCARGSDPDTSAVADRENRASGALEGWLAKCLHALVSWEIAGRPPPTNRELAAGNPALVHQYGRRLNDLYQRGLVERVGKRRCDLSGKVCLTWHTTDAGMERWSEWYEAQG